MERRLTAIWATDVLGYLYRPMRADEAGTLARLTDRYQQVLELLIGAYNERIVKLIGDGGLVETH